MGKYKSLGLLLFAIIMAAVAGFGAMNYLETREGAIKAQLDAQANYIGVIVPSRNLEVGDVVDESTVVLRQIPSAFVPDGALMPSDFGAVAGMKLKQPVTEGKPLMRLALEGLNGVERFSELLALGERAVTLDVNRLNTNEGMLSPGDHVDLLLISEVVESSNAKLPTQEGKKYRQLQILLENVVVLATGFKTIADPSYMQLEEGYSTITVGLTTEKASKILAAKEVGELSFLLRNPKDPSQSSYRVMSDLSANNGGVVGIKSFAGGKSNAGLLTETISFVMPSLSNKWSSPKGTARVYRKFNSESNLDNLNETSTSKGSPAAVDVTSPENGVLSE